MPGMAKDLSCFKSHAALSRDLDLHHKDGVWVRHLDWL
jgi:hypothetical protein